MYLMKLYLMCLSKLYLMYLMKLYLMYLSSSRAKGTDISGVYNPHQLCKGLVTLFFPFHFHIRNKQRTFYHNVKINICKNYTDLKYVKIPPKSPQKIKNDANLQIYSTFLTNDNSLHMFNLSLLKRNTVTKYSLTQYTICSETPYMVYLSNTQSNYKVTKYKT